MSYYMAMLSMAEVSPKRGHDQSTQGQIWLLQPLPPTYEALENMCQLLPSSPSPFQLPVLWAGQKWDAFNEDFCGRPYSVNCYTLKQYLVCCHWFIPVFNNKTLQYK